jgi:molecular chaperone GrpE
MNDDMETQPAPPAGAEPNSTRDDASAAPGGREAELAADVARLNDQLLRALAETENTRRRLEQQAEERGRYAVSAFARDVLAVADNLRRALDSIPADKLAADELAKKLAEGVELTERVLIAALERYGVKRIAAHGQRFDPHLHQAMMEVETDSAPPGTIVHEMQAGYTIHDRLLRPAMVSIAKAGAGIQPGAAGVDTKV